MENEGLVSGTQLKLSTLHTGLEDSLRLPLSEASSVSSGQCLGLEELTIALPSVTLLPIS